MAGLITVRTWSAFVLDEKTKAQRWGEKGQGVSAQNVIRDAVVSVPEYHRVARHPTDKNKGETRIDLRGISAGRVILHLEPPSVSLCDQPAGPLLAPPPGHERSSETDAQASARAKLMANVGIMARRRYRPLKVEIFLSDGFIKSLPPPRVVGGMTHGRVIDFRKDFLEVDWRPDWVSAKSVVSRHQEDHLVRTVESKAAPKKASELLSEGRWAIVLHRTTKPNIGSTLNEFINKGVNAHYVIDLDGHIVKLLDDRFDAGAHAGRGAQWEGQSPVNAFSIGIEVVNAEGAFPSAQMAGLLGLLDKLRKTFRISRDRVLAHGEVKLLELAHDHSTWINSRADCPGLEFDWPLLEKNGHATYPRFREESRLPPGFEEFFMGNVEDALEYENTDDGRGKYGKKQRALESRRHDLISQLQRNLHELGYEKLKDRPGEFGSFTLRLVERFQTRYLTGTRKQFLGDEQEYLGRVNLNTLVMMQAVLAARGKAWRSS